MQHRAIKILTLVIGIEATLVAIGWIFGVDSLTRILPHQGINMAFPTAIMFLLSAFALYFISRTIKNNYELAQIFLPGIILLMFLILVVILVAGFTDQQTGIENLFLHEQQYLTNGAQVAKLPSTPATISFILFGLASILSLFPNKNSLKIIKILGYFIFIIGLTAAVGYTLGLPMMYYAFNNTTIPMALNTALIFILLGCGLIVVGKSKDNEA